MDQDDKDKNRLLIADNELLETNLVNLSLKDHPMNDELELAMKALKGHEEVCEESLVNRLKILFRRVFLSLLRNF